MTWRKIQELSEGHIACLAEGFRQRVGHWYREATLKKIPVLIYSSLRTPKEQDELYAQGRTKKGARVTNARGTPVPQSYHCYGRAIDMVPCAAAAGEYTPSWDDEKTYAILQKMAEKHRLRAISWERPHLEDGDFQDWRELAAKESAALEPAPQNKRLCRRVKVRRA
jgi:peptidoglycan L-alanyl-D-glutamate endopeptidase CwlK